MLIDSHAHLDYEYEQSTEELLAQAKAVGVEKVLAIAAAADSLEKTKDLAEKFPQVFFTSGIHPHDSKDFSPEILQQIKTLAKHPKCVAIGELGLDYHYNLSDHSLQKSALEQQLEFSIQIGKPIVVHTREADEDTVAHLKIHSQKFQQQHPGKIPGVIHCFTGGKKLAEDCLRLGYFLSFSGIITFKNAEELRTIVKDIAPIEKILVETDSPFLAPIPYRGKKNQPAHVRIVAEKVAELKSMTLEEVAKLTKENTEKLFGLPK